VGRILGFLIIFFENIRRRSVRVLKLHSGFILTKKGDINHPKNSERETPLEEGGSLGEQNITFDLVLCKIKSSQIVSTGLEIHPGLCYDCHQKYLREALQKTGAYFSCDRHRW
jgi:hypothetical protein